MLFLALAAALAAPDSSAFQHAAMDARSASAGLETSVRTLLAVAPQPAWIAYAVPSIGGDGCCFDSHPRSGTGGGCRLEGGGAFTAPPSAAPIALEPARVLHVLLRVEQGRIAGVRAYSARCALDAAGRPVHLLTDVQPQQSVALLAALAGRTPPLPAGPGLDLELALLALAHHDESAVDPLLERLALEGPRETREQAVFWLGEARGRGGYEALRRVLQQASDGDVREHAAFALAQSPVPEALDLLIELARHDRSPGTRSQALFWLSQKAGRKAAAAIGDALRDDPDSGVKEQAVFALSQLPPDEGIPHLVRLARTHPLRGVREKAIFWLGQSEDARALAFFEEVLTR